MRTNITLTAKELNFITEKYARPAILSYFKHRGFCADKYSVEEVICRFCEKLAKSLYKYDAAKSQGAWFSTIARNCAYDYIMKEYLWNRFHIGMSFKDSDGDYCDMDYSNRRCSIENNADYQLHYNETIDVVKRAMRLLSKEDALIIELKMKGYSNDEIQDELSISEGAVRVRISRARKRFEECLAKARMCSESFCDSYNKAA